MGWIADLIQIGQALPSWGIWFVLFVLLSLLVSRTILTTITRRAAIFESRQEFNAETLALLKELSRIKGADPPKFIGPADLKNILEENRKRWEAYPHQILQRCMEMGCPYHQKMNEDMDKFHQSAQKALDKFVADAAVARAETLGYVKGIADDVELLHKHTLPTIQHIVEILSKHESGTKKNRD